MQLSSCLCVVLFKEPSLFAVSKLLETGLVNRFRVDVLWRPITSHLIEVRGSHFYLHCVSKKNRTPITFWNNSNKLCLIIVMISWENRQKVLNIVVCYGFTIFHKTVKDVDELKQRLVEVWSGLRQTVVNDAIDEWKRRLRACVRVKGQHFEHLL